jgi:hypothetical protein
MKVHEYNEMMAYLLRPKFANGGSTNPNFTAAAKAANERQKLKGLQMYINNFGLDVLNKIAQNKYGKNFSDLQGDDLNNLKRRLNRFESFIKENNRMPSETEARKFGRADRSKTIFETGGKEVTENDVRNKLINQGKPAETFKKKVIFADKNIQNKFEVELRKRYSFPKTSAAAEAAGVLNNQQLYETFLKPAGYKPDSTRTIVDNYKKVLDLSYKELGPEEKEAKKIERELQEKISQGGKRISGTVENPAHHMFPLGDDIGAKPREFTVIPKKLNGQIQYANKQMKKLIVERRKLLDKVRIAGSVNVKDLDNQLDNINKRADEVIKNHYKKYPSHEGLLNWKKIDFVTDDVGRLLNIRQSGTLGGDFKKWTLNNIDETILDKDIAKLNKDELRGFRTAINEVSVARDRSRVRAKLTDIEGVTTADKIATPEKTKTRNMFKDANNRLSANPFLDPRTILTGLGDVARVLGTPSVAATFAGTTIKENLDQGDSFLDAATDKMVGIDLLYPELAKQTVGKLAPRGTGILSTLGRFAANPFGRAARAFTPIGAGITAIGLGKDYYDFVQSDLARKAADPEAYAAEQEEQMGMSA